MKEKIIISFFIGIVTIVSDFIIIMHYLTKFYHSHVTVWERLSDSLFFVLLILLLGGVMILSILSEEVTK